MMCYVIDILHYMVIYNYIFRFTKIRNKSLINEHRSKIFAKNKF